MGRGGTRPKVMLVCASSSCREEERHALRFANGPDAHALTVVPMHERASRDGHPCYKEAKPRERRRADCEFTPGAVPTLSWRTRRIRCAYPETMANRLMPLGEVKRVHHIDQPPIGPPPAPVIFRPLENGGGLLTAAPESTAPVPTAPVPSHGVPDSDTTSSDQTG